MAGSGEDVGVNSPVILQHVVSGMVLVCIRHLPAVDSLKATNSEEYLSDDDEVENAFDDDDEKHIVLKRDELDKWIQSIRASVTSTLEYCNMNILPVGSDQKDSKLKDLCHSDFLGKEAPFHACDKDNEAAAAIFMNEILEIQEYIMTAGSKFEELDRNLVLLWNHRGETLLSMLKDAVKFLFEEVDLTLETIKIRALEIEYELSAWFKMPVFLTEDESGYIRANEVVTYVLANAIPAEDGQVNHQGDPQVDHHGDNQSGIFSLGGGGGGGSVISGTSGYTTSTRKGAEKQNTSSSLASVTDASVARAAGSVISATGTRGETASLLLNDKSAAHPLETLDKIIALFKERDSKDNVSASENPWTMHIMTPKRLRLFRRKIEDRFAPDPSGQGKTSMFLLACRWSFSTRHDKTDRKEDEGVKLSNNTLFGMEAHDCKDSIALLGSDLSSDSSTSASTAKRANIAMVQLGAVPDKMPDKKFWESPALQQFEQQLCNIEFVSPKNADKIRSGAQVSSIIRNFCAHLKYATDKRDLNDSDLEYYMAFVRRYNSRLQEAFDVVARSCLIDGFQPGATSDEVDSQGQLFFGSLGIVELAFSVIQVIA
jgi:hypothetical protein